LKTKNRNQFCFCEGNDVGLAMGWDGTLGAMVKDA
jgi:hypothetical protein